jgi:hypothetical protein
VNLFQGKSKPRVERVVQPVDKTPFGIQPQAAFFMRIIELGTDSGKKERENRILANPPVSPNPPAV